MAVYVEAGQNFAVNCIRDLLFAGLSAGLVPELLCLRPECDKLSMRDRASLHLLISHRIRAVSAV